MRTLEDDVVEELDQRSPLRLREMPTSQRNSVQLNTVNGFDEQVKIVLAVKLGNIAAVHGNGRSRLISSSESAALQDVAGAIDLTERAAAGQR